MASSLKSHRYWVYIPASKPNGTLYIGVTNSLQRRIGERKSGMISGFTKQYGLKTLGYFEEFRDLTRAIAREKELKGWLRTRKIELIRQNNLLWHDLAADWHQLPMDSSLRSE